MLVGVLESSMYGTNSKFMVPIMDFFIISDFEQLTNFRESSIKSQTTALQEIASTMEKRNEIEEQRLKIEEIKVELLRGCLNVLNRSFCSSTDQRSSLV